MQSTRSDWRPFLNFQWHHRLHPRPTSKLSLHYFCNLHTEISPRTNSQPDPNILKFSMTSWTHPRPTLRLCSCCVRALVYMLRTCACVHVAYVRLCTCCVRAMCTCCVRALVLMLRTCACVHVAYVRLCTCCVRALVLMLRTCACVHVAYVRLCTCCEDWGIAKDDKLGLRTTQPNDCWVLMRLILTCDSTTFRASLWWSEHHNDGQSIIMMARAS